MSWPPLNQFPLLGWHSSLLFLWLCLKAAPVFPDWQSPESYNVLERFFEVGRLALCWNTLFLLCSARFCTVMTFPWSCYLPWKMGEVAYLMNMRQINTWVNVCVEGLRCLVSIVNLVGSRITWERETSAHVCQGVSSLSSLRWEDPPLTWGAPYHRLGSWMG